jgi:hypothetical protein
MDRPMTKQRISQYRRLIQEIIMLEDKISSTEAYPDFDMVQASVGAGFQKKDIVVKGFGNKQLPKLFERKRSREAECRAIEHFINEVDDSIIFQLLTWRYIEGKTLQETAEKVGYSTNHAGRLIDNFFENNC